MAIKKIKETLKEDSKAIQKEVKEKSLGYVLGGFGVVAGLAWNDAVKALLNYIYPVSESGASIWAQFGYAAIMTVVLVVLSMYLSKVFKTEAK